MTVSTNSVSAQFVRITESCLLQRRRANDLSPVSSFFTIITIIITIILLIIIIVIIITIIKRSSTLFHRKQSPFLLFSFSFNKYCVTGNTAFCFSSNYTYAALLAFNLRLLLKTYLQIQRVPEHLACSFAASHLLSQHTHVHTRRENDFLVLNYSKYFLAWCLISLRESFHVIPKFKSQTKITVPPLCGISGNTTTTAEMLQIRAITSQSE